MPHLRDVLKPVVYARHDGSLPGEQPAWQAHQCALHVVPLLRNELYAVYKQPLEKSLLDNSANGIATSQPTEKIREKKVLLLLAERNSSISPVPTK